jgi:hypothetical protein
MQGGWGAQHRSDLGNFLFGLSSPGILVSTDIGVAAWAEGSMFFENVDPMRPMTHFPTQLEAISWPKREPMHRRMAQSAPPSGTT